MSRTFTAFLCVISLFTSFYLVSNMTAMTTPFQDNGRLEIPDITFNPFFLTLNDWNVFLSGMGPEGRDIYRLIGFFWDTAYPFCYTTFMVTGLQLVFGVKPWTFLVYFIFLSDLAENYVAGRLMAAFPFASMTDPQLVSLANLYSIFKFIKFLLYIPTMVLTLVLLLNLIFRTLFCGGGQKNRTTSLKKKGE